MAFYRSHKKSSSPGPTPPTPTTSKTVQVVTHSTGAYDASIYLKLYEGTTLIETKDVLYTNVTSDASSVYCGCVKLWYKSDYGWQLRATETCEYNSATYYAGDLIRTWTYNTSVDFDVTYESASAIVYKTYAHLNGKNGFSLPIPGSTTGEIDITFYEEEYVANKYVYTHQGNTALYITNNKFQLGYQGYNFTNVGDYSTGEHTAIFNRYSDNKLVFDNNEFRTAVASSSNYPVLFTSNQDNCIAGGGWVGYIKSFKMYDRSHNLICELKPAEIAGMPCFHDSVNDKIYYAEGMTVTDTIS